MGETIAEQNRAPGLFCTNRSFVRLVGMQHNTWGAMRRLEHSRTAKGVQVLL